MDELLFLGTGSAMTYHAYTTSISLTDGQSHFLTDGGSGIGVLLQLEKAGVSLDAITDVFITHLHTDHVLGAIWLCRAIGHRFNKGRTAPLTFYGHESVLEGFRTMLDIVLPKSILPLFGQSIHFIDVNDGQTLRIGQRDITFFDLGATKELQYGYTTRLDNGEVLAFLGDEPLHDAGLPYAAKATHLVHEALCLESESDIYHPHRIAHSTVKDAADAAARLNTPHLILFHSVDADLEVRKTRFTAEAALYYNGIISVPDDLDRIPLALEAYTS